MNVEELAEMGWVACEKRARPILEAAGVACEEGDDGEVYAPELIAAMCHVLKGKWLRWGLKKVRDDEEFREALIAVRRIDPRPISIVAFVVDQRQAEIVERKKRKHGTHE